VLSPGLSVTYATDPSAVLTLAGELDVATGPALRQALLDLLNKGEDVPDLTIDATQVTFVDSTGLAVLLMGARRWGAEERRMVLRPSPALSRLLDLTGVRRAFEVEEER